MLNVLESSDLEKILANTLKKEMAKLLEMAKESHKKEVYTNMVDCRNSASLSAFLYLSINEPVGYFAFCLPIFAYSYYDIFKRIVQI